MSKQITINAFQLANLRTYRESLLGLRVAYDTPNGNHVEGVVTNHPMYESKLSLAVTADDGRWAAIGSNDVLTLL